MKVKPLFHNSVFGTDIFRALAARHGYRNAIKEVNRALRHYEKQRSFITSDHPVYKDADLFVWKDTVQGHDFWSELQYGAYNKASLNYRNSRELRQLRVRR